jgi:hypothetical protein
MPIITPERLQELKKKISHAQVFLEQLQGHSPGANFDELKRLHTMSCESCISWVNEQYYSASNLIDSLKHDIKSKAKPHGIAMDKHLEWETDAHDGMPRGRKAVETVQMLDDIVNSLYPEAEQHLNCRILNLKAHQENLRQFPGPK